MQALGFIEVSGVVAAVDALDIMCKSANVQFVTWERKLGGRLVTVIVTGPVSDVTEAVENAKQACHGLVCATNVIPSPHEETARLVMLSASRLAPKQAEAKAEAKVEAAPKAAPKTRKTTAPKAAKPEDK